MNKKLEKLNFETLLDISFRLNSNVKLDELAEYLVFTLIGLFGIDEIQLLVPFDYLKKRQLVRIFPFDEKIIEFEENVFEKIMKGNLIFDSGIIKKICFSLENTYNNPNNFYLVWPLITNSQLSGVLILSKPLFETENNLNNMDENSFIKILSAQMAIAIQNAKFIREREKYNEFLVKSEKISTIGVLASSVAHDINNPLLCIMGYIRILEKKLDSPEIREYLSIIKNEINSCKRITQNLLDYSRNQRVTGESSDLIEILEKVVGLIRYECKKAKINLIFENEILNFPITIKGNGLDQVFINLCLNSIDALKNVANPKLRISTLSTDNGIKIFIEDNGCGIPEELKSKIFEPFVTSKEKGTGLGLAICREIIKSYSGEINLNLNKKRGVEFSIFLPE